jgi:hypothetical protein
MGGVVMTASGQRIPFPEVFASFRATVDGCAFRGLVLVGTLQADTPALLIAGLNPERVAFLLTDQSRPKLDEVRQRLAQIADQAPLRCSPMTGSARTAIIPVYSAFTPGCGRFLIAGAIWSATRSPLI